VHRTQIYLDPDQHRILLQEAALRGISFAELIRQIITEHLKRQDAREQTPREAYLRIVGMGASGRRDVSERHDHYLAEALKHDHHG